MSSLIRVGNLISETLLYKTNKRTVGIYIYDVYVIKRVFVGRPYNRRNDRSPKCWQSQFRQKWF